MSGLDLAERARSEPFGLWGRAFRPFFLGAAIFSAAAVPWWALAWQGLLPAPYWIVPMWWHGHEMLFGFVAAAIAGFLLTASPVWTGGPALTGRPLAGLALLWVAGRVAMAAAGPPGSTLLRGLAAVVDGAFLPAVALATLWTLRGSGQRRNQALVGILLALATANLAMHAEALGLVTGVAGRALRFGVDVVVVLVLVIGGRITPAFTQAALQRRGARVAIASPRWLGGLAIGGAALLAVVTLVLGRSPATGVLAGVAGLAAAARLAHWRSWRTGSDALLWSLHVGAAWLAVGLLLTAASDLGAPVPPAAGLHALTAGGMGATILAVMTRVGLGHTGRPLVLPADGVFGHACVNAAAAVRVVAAFGDPGAQQAWMIASGLLWAGAFLLFALRYAPILTAPRPDGRPG